MPIRAENRAQTGQNRFLNSAARQARLQPDYPSIHCRCCGRVFAPYRQVNVHFCSTRCRHRQAYRDAHPKIAKHCAHCGVLFTPDKSNKRLHCGDICRSAAFAVRLRARPDRLKNRRQWARRYARTANYRIGQANHKARRRSAERTGYVSLTQWRAILDSFGRRCAYCGRSGMKLTMDHVVPLSKGGRHEAANLVPACQPCNSAKGNGDWGMQLQCP